MNHCAMQQNAFAACEEMRGGSSSVVVDRRSPVFCPKPRRLDPLSAAAAAADPVRPLRWHASHQADLSDFKAGSELLDLFLTKRSAMGILHGLCKSFERSRNCSTKAATYVRYDVINIRSWGLFERKKKKRGGKEIRHQVGSRLDG
ncbi:uncharacterized protein LOC103712909 isoform X2 [Phoenix dactylifera]|uniref:Uncharacterized protein LOC103712909 isoform X2 n=1 Tax=Phoenix dactylifera TaxID=42345 RepID=A0A8B7CF79_PHODC|nr:uncharacterized protein LOC103712909 isoform X2 [Phoenix dactylifera]